jgi:hypothetical protein
VIKSGMQEQLEEAGYIFHFDINEDGSIKRLGFTTPPPIILDYHYPPQVGVSLERIQVELVRIAWRHYSQKLHTKQLEALLRDILTEGELGGENARYGRILLGIETEAS